MDSRPGRPGQLLPVGVSFDLVKYQQRVGSEAVGGKCRLWSIKSIRNRQIGVILLEESVMVVRGWSRVQVLRDRPWVRQEMSLVLGPVDGQQGAVTLG